MSNLKDRLTSKEWEEYEKQELKERLLAEDLVVNVKEACNKRFKELAYDIDSDFINNAFDFTSFHSGFIKGRMDAIINAPNEWISIKDNLPKYNETVLLCNDKHGTCFLGCLVDYGNEGSSWAESNGIIYVKNGKIVAECYPDELDVTHWQSLPIPLSKK